MGKRTEPRWQSEQPARLTVLGPDGKQLACRIVNVSGRGMGITVDEAIRAGTSVKVECDDALLLGETCYCRPAGGKFAIGLKLEHVVFDSTELALLSQRLWGERSGPVPRLEPGPAGVGLPSRP